MYYGDTGIGLFGGSAAKQTNTQDFMCGNHLKRR